MQSYTLDEARRIVMQCAKQYQANLLDRMFIVIYKDGIDHIIKDIEIKFSKRNYQHLTGIELIDDNGNLREHVSELFYTKCVNNRLSKTEIRLKKDGTTNLKLAALPVIMGIHKVTKIAGDFNNVRPYLVADKVVGNVNFSLGLKQVDSYYVPASALLENIKQLTDVQSQVLAVISKEAGEHIFSNIRHVAKGVDLNCLSIPTEIAEKINLEHYRAKVK